MSFSKCSKCSTNIIYSSGAGDSDCFACANEVAPLPQTEPSQAPKEDIIAWPKHYTQGVIQPIDFIESHNLDFRLANAVKYIARAGKKDPSKLKEDLEKALWYINRFIQKECNEKKST